MMTKPTREQQQACDQLTEALLLTTSAAQLDGRAAFGATDLRNLLATLARATSAFRPGEVVDRALERRGKGLGLRPGTSDLLGLIEGEGGGSPLDALLLDDDAFRALVARAEEALGGVV